MAARSVLLTALVAAGAAVEVAAQDSTVIDVDIPDGLATRPLVPDVYGYSIEPIWVDAYTSTPLAATLLRAVANVTGKPPPIRVGGNTADQTYLHDGPLLPDGNVSAARPGLPAANRFDITPAWFRTWGEYFPDGTELTYTLNLAANASGWANAVAQAAAAGAALGPRLAQFELGNEVDHFIAKGWRGADWGVDAYVVQFRNLTGQIAGADWYAAAGAAAPKFQAGVIADPPWVHDQHDEIDDFSVANLTRDGAGGIAERPEDRALISSYAMHLYPQSSCDPARWLRMRLDLLSNHTTLWLGINISQYGPQIAAAERAGAPFVMGETNSVSCGGRSGISDTFGAALWGVDYVLGGAALGIRQTFFHLGAQSEYSAFTPAAYELKNESLAAGIRPGWYAHYFVARVAAPVAGANRTQGEGAPALGIAALPGANTSALSGYAVYAGRALRRLVFLDVGVWNGTAGLGNPSTLRATDARDAAHHSAGARPAATLRLATPWCAGARVAAARLAAPGTNAKSGVTVAGLAFDPSTGAAAAADDAPAETLVVAHGGALAVPIRRAEAVLLELQSAGDGCAAKEKGERKKGGH
ncbi:hypothetical protein GGS23DRAFT_603590 [Durotheca rogersii]|uniref:uncharacterized protein n=1 Tax=Durotheca rogersii TaxID=419775 RepID=UPI002220FC8E|nr:uncharacterized protein GGS23DRAFT_603590 [Durotheca rogersii]KAI5866245.1 hypothetical protein GGS23DRAFT_603590 [Durotheca rogersii]